MDITTEIIEVEKEEKEEKEETISEYILSLRLKKGVTQYKAAKGININRAALKRLEDGNYIPTRRTLKAMSEYYEAPLNVLLQKTEARRAIKRAERRAERKAKLAKENEK